jgi:hypothetical protein
MTENSFLKVTVVRLVNAGLVSSEEVPAKLKPTF